MKVSLLLIVLLAVAVSHCSAQILARKAFTGGPVIAKQSSNVEILIVNLGDEPVYDVRVVDNTWGSDWVVNGSASAHYAELPAGHKIVHVYQVTPQAAFGYVNIPPAQVLFKEEGEDEPDFILSSSLLRQPVYQSTYYSRVYSMSIENWGVYAALSAASVLPSFLVWYYYQSSFENGIKKRS